ncbi:MAG: 30S ribosomal protein S8 [Desulfobacterales bacterium]|jgi:small subunit ribosomal protein S8|nr:30S ribosomal protein S8 [Desulfobulbaceae bacterium]MDX2434580.1 30S ribosomal protein S8 [Desulfobacterales bacterium]
MSMSDPLADLLTRIRNAGMVRHESVDVPMSNLKVGVVKVLRAEGYINDYQIIEDNKQGTLRIALKYGPNNERVISGIRRISKPGLRKYVKADDIPKVLSGLGISILSTSKGIITDREARRLCVGGEILCEAW